MAPLTFLLWFNFFIISFAANNGGLFGFIFGYRRFCFCRCGVTQRQYQNGARSGKLLGGESVTPNKFPWLVLVHTGSEFFGGSLISDRHVITAASPLYRVNVDSITVTLGAHDLCRIGGDPVLNTTVETVLFHYGYTSINAYNDIALLRTRHAVPFGQFISPICLPLNDVVPEEVAWVASWMANASLYSCTPRALALPVLPSRACLSGTSNYHLFTSDKGCLGPLGATGLICKGDAGAPVMARWTPGTPFRLVGVISSASCEDSSTPLYTKVTEHTAWIREQIRDDCQCI